jgi:hypothetical protein
MTADGPRHIAVEERLTRVLGCWAVGSLLVGAALSLRPATRGFGRQTAAWGAVDGAIALVGARRRAARGPTDPARLRRVLLVNAGLDVGYLAAGVALLRLPAARARGLGGDGLAVIVQGGFLLLLDSVAARALRPRPAAPDRRARPAPLQGSGPTSADPGGPA